MKLFARDLSVLLDAIVDAVFIHPFPTEGRPLPFVFVNEAACHLLGYSREALLEMTILEIDGSYGAMDVGAIIARLGQGSTERFEQEFIVSDGSLVPVEVRTVAHTHQGTRYIVSAVRDMTRRKADEALLRSREQLLDLFFKQSLDGFFFMMLDEPLDWATATDREAALDTAFATQRITRTNQAFLDQYGATEADLLGATPADFFEHDLERGRAVWAEFFDNGHLHVETEERRLDGAQLMVEGDYICLYDDQGRITGHFGVQRDTTARHQSLRLLLLQRDVASALAAVSTLEEASEAVLDAALTVASVDSGGMYTVTEEGGLHLLASRGLSERFLRAATIMAPTSPQALFALEGTPLYGRYDRVAMESNQERLDEGLRAMASIPVVHDGITLAVLNVASHTAETLEDRSRSALEAIAAQVGGALARLRAMEQKEAAELHAAAQEILLREVNHRVKNNLSAIMGILHLEEDKARLTGGVPTAEAMASVVGRVRGLAKVHELASQHRWQPILVTELCERVLHSATHVATHEVVFRIHPSPASVGSHLAHHLALVLNELFTNSLKHAQSPLEVEVTATLVPSGVCLVYRDDGPGYPAEVVAGQGHGIGLELAFGITRRSLRGTLVLDSDDGARATLTFRTDLEAP